GTFRQVDSVWLWAFILIVMAGVIAGNIRSIALPTLVTVLIPEDVRDRANGLVGMVTGIGFLTTSVISGFLVAFTGMLGTMIFALGVTLIVLVHLALVRVDEGPAAAAAAPGSEEEPRESKEPRRVDI